MRIISRKDVESSISMPKAIKIVREAFVELSGKTAVVPPRIHLSMAERRATTLVMPAFLSGGDALACKIVSVFPENAAKNLPLIHAVVILLNAETGEPLAAIEGASLTALRTGAASGLATDLLARKNADSLVVIGAGTQSRTQIEAVCAIRKIRKIRVFDRKIENARKLVAEMKLKIDAEFMIAESSEEAFCEADIICAATTSEEPVFDGENLRKGTHINGVGSFTPRMREIDFATLKRSKIVVDSRENALAEAGELAQALELNVIAVSDIYAEIGEIAAGLKAGRENEEEITFFKSVGNAVQDAAIADAIYRTSLEKSFGVEVSL